MDRYTARIKLHGSTQRERNISRLKDNIFKKASNNPSCKDVKINGEDTQLIINSGTKTYYKEFEAFPGQKILVGDYVEWANCIWLVYEADCDDEIYIDGKMYQCNYTQRWLNNSGELIERPSFVLNASAYNNGETGNKIITLASNQFMVYMPIDEETLKISNGKRMFMDYSVVTPSVYKLTRPDNVSFKFGEGGITYYIFTQTERTERDKVITLDSGESIWIADYFSPTSTDQNNETTLSSVISGSKTLRAGFARTYSVTFADEDGVLLTDVDFEWNINCDFGDKITSIINDDKTIRLQVNDEGLIGSSFLLEVLVDDSVIDNLKIVIDHIY